MVANSVNESEMLDEKDNLYFDLLFESNLYIWNEFFFLSFWKFIWYAWFFD